MDCLSEFDFAGTPINKDTTVYEGYEAYRYTVYFDAMGDSPAPEDHQVPYSSKAAVPTPEPEKYGCLFNGWYEDKDCNI